jgi:hypothetical protein
MYERILQKIRLCVAEDRIYFTIHALEEMDADNLFKVDLEHCIMQGQIVHRQWDDEFLQYKYLIDGPTTTGDEIEIVAKLATDGTVIITAYLL